MKAKGEKRTGTYGRELVGFHHFHLNKNFVTQKVNKMFYLQRSLTDLGYSDTMELQMAINKLNNAINKLNNKILTEQESEV